MRSVVFSRKGFHVKSVFLFFVWSTFCCVVYNKWYHSRRFQLRSAAPGDSPLRSRSSIVAALFNGSASRRSRHRAALPRSSIHRSETQSSQFSSMSGVPVFGDPSAKLDSARRDRSDMIGVAQIASPVLRQARGRPYAVWIDHVFESGTTFDPPFYLFSIRY